MPRGSRPRLIACAVAALLVAAGAPLLAQNPVAIPTGPITIQSPANVAAGGELCFAVISFGGHPSVVAEVNDVSIPVSICKTDDPSVYAVCCKVPGGASGSTIVITAVNPAGGVATATVSVH